MIRSCAANRKPEEIMGKLDGQVAIVTGAVIPIDGGLVRG